MMSRRRLSPWRLERLNIDSFGKLSNASVGPFAPGMNVVFGRNESGKTTLSSFIEGVLFGWPDGRSCQNTYKPENAERSGSLLFRAEDGSEALLRRVRNVDGVEDPHGLLADVDAPTYSTVFALDSDELLSLGDTSAVTTRLLTAGSGTAVSPAHALAEVDARIARSNSRAASAGDSIANLTERLQAVDAELARADEEAAGLIDESREYQELAPARAALADEHERLNALIEGRSADLSLLQAFEEQLEELRRQRSALAVRLSGAQAGDASRDGATADAAARDVAELREVSPEEGRAIRDALEDFQAERERLASAADHAERDLANSKAAYAVLEDALDQGERRRGKRSRVVGQAVLSIILPLIALVAGIPTVIYGTSIGSVTIFVFGGFLVVAAFIMGAAALVAALRPPAEGATPEQRLEDARWVMLQDQKKLAACEADLSELDERVAAYCRFNHLASAGGNLRRARALLDEARESRMARSVAQQQVAGLQAQLASVEESIARIQAQRSELLADADVADALAFEELVAQAVDRRRALMEEEERMDTRLGELAQRLSQARGETEFARLKQERAALSCRLDGARADLACLLIARRTLADAIAHWEEESQPAMYRLASSLFAKMTGGAWTQVRLNAAGEVQVADGRGENRDPSLLSLGTRQQLYLSLRIALLMTACNVGRAVPVLADDILVNFDAERRRAAASALLELAQMRQVILFTCHEEVRDLLCRLEPGVNVVRLP